MIRGISFSDIQRIPEFSKLSQFELLDRKYEARVAPYAFILGCNVDKSPIVQAVKHRTLDNKVVVGYRYVYLERTDKEYLLGKLCSMSARIAAQTDGHLAADMIRMSQEGLALGTYQQLVKVAKNERENPLKQDEHEEDCDEVRSLIASLQSVQVSVRGPLGLDEDMLNVEESKG